MAKTLIIHGYTEATAYERTYGYVIGYPDGNIEKYEYGKFQRLFKRDDDPEPIPKRWESI
jgi:hypothetical protein